MLQLKNDYRAPLWLPGGHLQTVLPQLWGRYRRPPYRRERWDTPDGDFIDLDWVDADPSTPLVVLFHGLEGSSSSSYSIRIMQAVRARGWRGVVVHFRGCSGEPNRLLRAYHSGDSAEIDWVLRRLRANETTALFVVAISLSANTFLKWCGETGESAGHLVDAAAAVCAPVDMVAAGQNLSRGFGAIYGRYFLRTLLPKALAKQSRFPGHLDRLTLASIRTLYDFDEHVTAPLHGFRGAMDYWQRTSSNKLLFRVRIPTLLLHSRNDPLIPYASVPPARSLSSSIVPETPQHGGHVGFASGGRQAADDRATWPDWLPQRILAHFDLLRAPV